MWVRLGYSRGIFLFWCYLFRYPRGISLFFNTSSCLYISALLGRDILIPQINVFPSILLLDFYSGISLLFWYPILSLHIRLVGAAYALIPQIDIFIATLSWYPRGTSLLRYHTWILPIPQRDVDKKTPYIATIFLPICLAWARKLDTPDRYLYFDTLSWYPSGLFTEEYLYFDILSWYPSGISFLSCHSWIPLNTPEEHWQENSPLFYLSALLGAGHLATLDKYLYFDITLGCCKGTLPIPQIGFLWGNIFSSILTQYSRWLSLLRYQS